MPTPSTLLELAQAYFDRGAFAEAADALRKIPPQSLGDDARVMLGASLARVRRGREAVAVFEDVLSRNPDCFPALTWMAVLKKNRLEADESIVYAKRAIALQPQEAGGHTALGSCYLYLRRPVEAIESFRRAVEIAPDFPEHQHNLALALFMNYEFAEGVDCMKRAIALAPKDIQSYLTLSNEYVKNGMMADAVDCLQDGIRNLPDSHVLYMALGTALTKLRRDDAAEQHYRKALSLSPAAKPSFGAWLLNHGRFEESIEIFEDMIRTNTSPALAYFNLVQARKLTADDRRLVDRMEQMLSRRLGAGEEMYLRFALGRAHEQLKQYEQAMAHFDEGNRLAYAIYNAGRPMEPGGFEAHHNRILRCFEQIPPGAEGYDSEEPVFIVGMIRSGTTLLDQILSSHPSVEAAGELRVWVGEAQRLAQSSSPPGSEELRDVGYRYVDYLERLVGRAERITDKMPLNFSGLGIIHRALPRARFVHIRRHPVDTALSMYTTFFGDGTDYGYSKASIVEYYREYRRMMAYWRSALPPGVLFELDYEELIADPEPLIRRVVAFCGLPWDDACLHHEQNETAIVTPSRWQARQPIYRSSVERWRNYEPWLGEFRELL